MFFFQKPSQSKSSKSTRKRKEKFGPFEQSFESSVVEPAEIQPRRSIIYAHFQVPFTDDPKDYFGLEDKVPYLSTTRNLRKGDILEVTVLSVDNPGSFYVRIHSPKRLLAEEDLTNSLSKFTERLTNFCKRLEDDNALKIGYHDLSIGM